MAKQGKDEIDPNSQTGVPVRPGSGSKSGVPGAKGGKQPYEGGKGKG